MRSPLVLIAAAGIALAARHAKVPTATPETPDSGGGYLAVYLEPLPAAARALAPAVEGVSAVRGDGTKVPLRARLAELGGAGGGRERLLAWGTIPDGAYSGLEIRARSAGRAAAAAESPIGFRVSARRAAVVDLGLTEAPPAEGESAPVLAFVASAPARIASGLIGAVSSPGAAVVTLFDKVSGQVSSVVPTGRGAAALALDAERNRLYVALTEDDAVATVDLLSSKILATTPLRAGDEPVALALTPDGKTLLAANAGSETVAVLDASGPTLVERTRVPVGSGPSYVLVDPSGSRAWVFCTLDDALTVIALPGGTVAGTVTSVGGPSWGAFDRAGSHLYVIHRTSPYLDAVDTAAATVAARAYVGPGASAIAVDPQTDRIYLGFRDSDRIEIYDPAALLPVDGIRTGSGPGFLTIDPEGNDLCVLLPRSDGVTMVRLAGKAVAARVDVPGPAQAVLQGGR